MTRAFRSELIKLRRPGIIAVAIGVLSAFAILGTILDFVVAKETSDGSGFSAPDVTLSTLTSAGGLTVGFSTAVSFVGLLIFVVFMASTTSEYAQGTFRSMLTRQPGRGSLLAGKYLGLVAFTGAALLVAEVVGAVTAVITARVRGVSTSHWFGLAGLQHAASDFGNAMLATILFGAAGMGLALLLRSTLLTLGVGIAWVGPIEHITQLSWSDAGRWFPGLLFDSVAAGGTADTSYQRAVLLSVAMAVVVGIAAAASFLRRDLST